MEKKNITGKEKYGGGKIKKRRDEVHKREEYKTRQAHLYQREIYLLSLQPRKNSNQVWKE